MKKVVEVKNLTKKFGQTVAVNNISFEIREGQIVGLLGPNGAGKTTTMAMLLGLIKPTEGEIRLFGQDPKVHRSEIHQQLNFSATYTRFRGRMTVFENLYVYSLLYNLKNPRQKIEKLLEVFEISSLKNKLVVGLSNGQMTRLSLCKALINNPRLLFLDEPTASLDPDIAEKTREFLFKIRRDYQVSMLYTSHNMSEVAQMCDWIIFLNKGKIVAQDTPLNLTKMIEESVLDLVFEADLASVNQFGQKHRLDFSIPRPHNLVIKLKEEEIPAVLERLSRSPIKITEIEIKKPDLEDVFLKIARHHETSSD